ncbi:protein of unknown function [Pseudodesulfovibrio piezophilus C1TLV30]|uniref:Uncharacterized protein n=2 Tax=Pseudodesulfovibrio TaxID=2035811 RepID=M1WXY9_PSEP2|nr:protein of unknown function [Pseudodesulfovibrio piezophilus C1TLV30]
MILHVALNISIKALGDAMKAVRRIVCVVVLACCLGACTKDKYDRSMEDVARNWCMTIRASQVIPIYPLEESIRPGDVFLVGAPHAKEVTLYREKGFLPMDTHLHRISGLEKDYVDFYGEGYLNEYPAPPKKEVSVANASSGQSSNSSLPLRDCANSSDEFGRLMCLIEKQNGAKGGRSMQWPLAVFPSYTVKVGTDASLGAGLSLKGIPLGLSFLHASQALAMVTIKDSYSVGLPVDVLYPEVTAWAARPEASELLDEYVDGHENVLYVRLITKVFLAQQFDIALLSNSQTGGRVNVNTESAEGNATADNATMTERLTELVMQNLVTAAADQMPKGEVAFMSGSSSAVSLRETLDRPVVLGYHAVDIPVFDGGRLGAPVATQSFLLDRATPLASAREIRENRLSIVDLNREVNSLSRTCAVFFMHIMADRSPDRYGSIVSLLDRLVAEAQEGSVTESFFDATKKDFDDVTDDWINEAANASTEESDRILRSIKAEYVRALGMARRRCESMKSRRNYE